MGRLYKRSQKVGLPPGTLVHTGEKKTARVNLSIMDYDAQRFEEKTAGSIAECHPYKDSPTVTWLNIDGVHDIDGIEDIGKRFGIQPLFLEDIVSTGQRPKFEESDDYIFIVLTMLHFDEEKEESRGEQISIVFGENFLITFQENKKDVFNPVRERIRKGKGRIRKGGTDYLAYALMDEIVDFYYVILEKLGERIERLEGELISDPPPDTMQTIHRLKREMIFLRKSIWPLREVISGMERFESRLITKSTRPYLRDLYDHTIQVIDTVESFRDMVSGMLDIYLSSVSNKMNEVMKVLTIIATIFIPLTFIAGIYGMNFEHMPELGWGLSYPIGFWSVIIIIIAIMVFFFKKKHWL